MSKKLEIILLGILCTSLSLYAAGRQIQLNNGVWQAIGFQGAYTTQNEDTGYDADSNFEFYDIADENTTWVAVSSTDSTDLIYNDPSGQTTTYGPTTQLNSVIGLFVIIGKRSKKTTNFITLDGSSTNVVKLKVPEPLTYRTDIPMYRMYVEGGPNDVAFRLDFQADYQGKRIRVRFGEETNSYFTYFNYENTYDNPARLREDGDGSEGGGAVTDIQDAVDFNISDNNLTQLLATEDFQIKTASGDYGSSFTPFSADSDNRIEVYSMINNTGWQRYDTANTLTTSNTVTQFTPGRGYWIRATSQLAHNDGNYTKIGLITRDRVDINEDSVYGTLENGWHMLSFASSDLRYAPSGIFLPRPLYGNGVDDIGIFFTRHGSDTTSDPNSAQTRGALIGTSELDNNIDINASSRLAKMINLSSMASHLIYGERTNMRAYPAMSERTSVDENGTAGVIILADQLFEVNSSNSTIVTLAGLPLRQTARGHYSSRYGEFMLAATLNDFRAVEVNASIAFSMPSYSSEEQLVSDLNDSNRSQILSNMVAGLRRAATRTVGGTPDTNVTGYLMNLDFNSTFDLNASNVNILDGSGDTYSPHILLAAGARFSIADRTITRLYKYEEQNGNFRIVGPNGASSAAPTGNNDITQVINTINDVSETTGVRALNLGANSNGDSFIMITANTSGAIRLEEDYNATLFTDINLDTSLLPEANQSLADGMIIEVFGPRQLLDRPIIYDLSLMDGNITTDNNISWSKIYDYNISTDGNGSANTALTAPSLIQDLRSNAIWAPDFPIRESLIQTFSEYGKEILSISTQRFSHDNIAYYDFIDVTKDPEDWYGNSYDSRSANDFDNDYQGIFHIFPNHNYWVRIQDKQNLGIDTSISSDSTITVTARSSFNNTLEDGKGVTQNHIAHTLNIKFNDGFIDPLNNDYYNVVAIIEGIRFYLRENGDFFTLSINDAEISLTAKEDGAADDSIFINAYDGVGNILSQEELDASTYSIYFQKPPTPEISWDGITGGMQIDNISANNKTYERKMFTAFISDIDSERSSDEVAEFNDSSLGWMASEDEEDYGQLRAIRLTLKDPDYDLYSDVKAVLYAPLNQGHVLRVSRNVQVAQVPYSYSQGQYLTNQEAGSTEFDAYNGSNGVNNGIQMTMLEGATNRDLYLAYYPEGAESQRRITQFGGSRTMYLSILNDDSTNEDAVVEITYLTVYEGKMFYVYFNGVLYQGRFQGNDTFNNDSSAYNMSSSILTVDAIVNTRAMQTGTADATAVTTQGYKVQYDDIDAQPIVIPATSPSNATTNTTPAPTTDTGTPQDTGGGEVATP